MRFFRRSKPVPTLEALARAEDDVVRLFARILLNLQVRMEDAEREMRVQIGRIDVLDGRDSSAGSLRGESFQQLHNELTVLKRQMAQLRGREEAAVGL